MNAKVRRIPLAARVIQLAEFAEVAYRNHGIGGAVEGAERGSATQFDPNLVAIVQADAEKIFRSLDEVSSWEPVLDGEPALRVLSAAELDEALAAIARFVDLKSPSHARPLPSCRHTGPRRGGMSGPARSRAHRLYRAGLTADSAPGRVECHLGQAGAAHRRRVGTRPPRPAARGADAAPIRGAGTNRRASPASSASVLTGPATRPDSLATPSPAARLLAAADSYQAMLEPRPHRPARSANEAAGELRCDARAGRLDPDAVAAVLAAAGHRVARPARRRRSHRQRDRRPAPRRARPVEQADRSQPRRGTKDRRQPHRAHLHQDRSVEPGRSSTLRHAQRTSARHRPPYRSPDWLTPLNTTRSIQDP